ncbi:MAG: bifunctional riboflavin kinase/FAD synthetase [Betaproteobacteria bacterium]|nr:bifunctional riboflavin kinase/FAD synthetase [Betaproteobacteria bacterium]
MIRLILHRSLAANATENHGLTLAIGNFDGVHIGHQAILKALRDFSSEHALTPAVLSFEPLPREYFSRIRPELPAPARLMGPSEKLAAFERAGIRHAFIPRFNADFAAQSPDEFIASLVKLPVRWLAVGEDFRFGARRMGDIATLRSAGAKFGFGVETLADIEDRGHRVSSTAIRDALAAGNLASANAMLGRPYSIIGRVTHGKKLGRTLGFPTANVSLGCAARQQNPAIRGVFAVRCRLVTRGLEGVAGKAGVILNGVANLGTNPVVSSENRHHLEIFLFDFADDLYGQRLEVSFIEKIRDEQKFASLDALVTQMHDDTAQAKHILRMTEGKTDGPES